MTISDMDWLTKEIGAYADRISSWLQTTPPQTNEEYVTMLVAIRDLRADLAFVASELERDLLKSKPPKHILVEGLGEAEVKHSKRYTEWKNEELTAVVVARALDERILDETTGEFEAGFSAVARVLSECARPSWRVTPLRARGIQIDEFCHVEDAATSVVLPKRVDK